MSQQIELNRIAQTIVQPEARCIVHQGGTSSGKTFNIMIGLCVEALRENKECVYTILGASLPMLKRGAMHDLLTFLNGSGIKYKRNISDSTFMIGRAKFQFIGADAKLAQAPKQKKLFVDEANFVSYETFQKFHDRTELTIIAYNPSAEFWVQDKILPLQYDKSDGFERYAKLYISTYRNNKYLPKTRIEDIERYRELDYEYYKVYGLGLRGKVTGQIFKRVEHVNEWPNDLKWQGYGMDFGSGPDPTVIVEAGEKDGNLYVRTLMYEYGFETNELIQAMEYRKVSKDRMIYADHMPMIQRTIATAGYRVMNAFKGAGSVEDGIKALNTYTKIFIVNSPEMWKESQRYIINEKNGKPIDKDNHAFDALRYWYAGNIGLTTRII